MEKFEEAQKVDFSDKHLTKKQKAVFNNIHNDHIS